MIRPERNSWRFWILWLRDRNYVQKFTRGCKEEFGQNRQELESNSYNNDFRIRLFFFNLNRKDILTKELANFCNNSAWARVRFWWQSTREHLLRAIDKKYWKIFESFSKCITSKVNEFVPLHWRTWNKSLYFEWISLVVVSKRQYPKIICKSVKNIEGEYTMYQLELLLTKNVQIKRNFYYFQRIFS